MMNQVIQHVVHRALETHGTVICGNVEVVGDFTELLDIEEQRRVAGPDDDIALQPVL